MLLGLLACDPYPEPSDLDQWEVGISLDRWIDGQLDKPARFLVGTDFEVSLLRWRDDSGMLQPISAELGECIALDSSGSLDLQGREALISAAGPGSVDISAPPQVCPGYSGEGEDLLPDRWSVIGVAADDPDLVGEWISSLDAAAIGYGSPGPAGEFPDDFGSTLGPAMLVEGGIASLEPVLMRVEDEGRVVEVRGGRKRMAIDVPAHYQALVPTYEGDPGLGILGDLPAGDTIEPSLQLDDRSLPLPSLEGVAIEQITSLELVAVYERSEDPDREWGPPVGIVAITRDARGQRVLGAPIEWSLTRGRLALDEGQFYSSDELILGDSCRDKPRRLQARAATIEARIGDLVETVDLEWIARWSDGDADPDSPLCVGSACDCSTSAEPGPSTLAGLGLLVLGLGLRRPRRAAQT